MTHSRKKPGVAFWATVAVTVLALLFAYPLSFGPACWICGSDQLLYGKFCSFYRPLLIALQHCPRPIRSGARLYVEFWLPDGLEFKGEPHGSWFHQP